MFFFIIIIYLFLNLAAFNFVFTGNCGSILLPTLLTNWTWASKIFPSQMQAVEMIKLAVTHDPVPFWL